MKINASGYIEEGVELSSILEKLNKLSFEKRMDFLSSLPPEIVDEVGKNISYFTLSKKKEKKAEIIENFDDFWNGESIPSGAV